MGKAFKRLEKQVGDRRAGVQRQATWQSRIAALEVFLLELGAAMMTEIQLTDGDVLPHRQALVEAYTDYRKHLEGVVQK